MPRTPQMTIRLSKIQRLHLEKLAAKFQIDQSNVIRIAIARLAEQEGIVNPEKGRPR